MREGISGSRVGENAEGRLLLLPVLGGAQNKEPESSAMHPVIVSHFAYNLFHQGYRTLTLRREQDVYSQLTPFHALEEDAKFCFNNLITLSSPL